MLTETGSTKDAEISGHGVSDERTENPHSVNTVEFCWAIQNTLESDS